VAKRLKNEYWAAVRVERQALVAKIEQKDATFADAVRRAVVYTHFENGRLLAASVLDCEQRSISVYIGGETSKLPDVLAQFGILAGLSVRELLHQFTLEPTSWRVVDLNSPQKTRRINKSGRTLRINAAMLITSSVGISRPLGDDDKMDEYLRNGDTAKLRRRLESNVKSLFAFYNYGRLHGCLRLRWGFLDENLSVSWSLPGDPSLYDVLKQSQESHAEIEFVTGSAPGWQAPWSRARRGVVVELDWHDVVLQVGSERQHFSRYDFQAIRFVGAQDAQPH
jgi:hypothetical protein